MVCEEIISTLNSMSSEKYKANVVKMGIPADLSIGVSTAEIRKLATKIPKSNDLAYALWHTGLHEAKLLAVLVFDKKTLSLEDAGQLMVDVVSWDLCDHLCKNLIMKLPGYEILISEWCQSNETYVKRGAFILIASAIIHDKAITEQSLDHYLSLIATYSNDGREHVKKAVSVALRELGKKNFKYQEKAILLAYEMKESGNKPQIWIAKDALRELEKLVKSDGRSRLISSDSSMGNATL